MKVEGKKVTTDVGNVGLQFRLIGDHIVVTQVEQKSSAAEAGIQAGWILYSVDDVEIGSLITRLEKALQNTKFRLDSMLGLRLAAKCSDTLGDKLSFVFLDSNNKQQAAELEMREPDGTWIVFGNFGAMLLQIENRTLDDSVQYFRFSVFFEPVSLLSKFEEALAKGATK